MDNYTAIDIAEYVINRCTKDSKPISNLQLQKILYYIQLQFIKKSGKPIFKDEIEAWKFGPVVPAVYYKYCGFGSSPILLTYPRCIINKNLTVTEEINTIIEEKRKLNPWRLVDETHNPKGPWSSVYKLGHHNVISVELMSTLG